ncbi:MAG TPA: hypothetical protein VMY37_04575 [Thermoguttaceae bacterium]|nr:hypothetical protein [Thermoguttaceae bacterium]
MADDITLNAGAGGSDLATDEIGGAHHQKILVGFGPDGTWTRVNAGAGFPVSIDSFGTGIDQGAGVVGSNTQRVTLANDDALTAAANALLTTIDADTDNIATSAASIDGKVTACNTGAVIISSGTITTITNPVAVTGTFWQGTQPISAAALPLPAGAATEATLNTLSGKVTACNTGAVVISSALPAGTAEMGFVGSAGQSDYAYDAAVKCTVKRFKVLATADAQAIISAPSGSKKIRLRSLAVIALSATGTTIYLETGATQTAELGSVANPIPIAVDADGNNHGGFVLPINDDGWLETTDADETLAVKMPGGAQPMQFIGTYIEVA